MYRRRHRCAEDGEKHLLFENVFGKSAEEQTDCHVAECRATEETSRRKILQQLALLDGQLRAHEQATAASKSA